VINVEKLYEKSETGCCPRFDPKPWDGKEIRWEDKLFLKDHVRSFFHMPFGFGKMVVKNMEIIKNADALAPQPLMLSDEKSMWGADVYIAVSKEIPKATTERISGTFLSKVFEGPYKNMGKWVKEMEGYAKSRGKEIKKMYFFYTTCPRCAKTYGKNYVVVMAKV